MQYKIPNVKNKYGFGDCRQAIIQTVIFNYGINFDSLPALYFGFHFAVEADGSYILDKAGLIDDTKNDWLIDIHGVRISNEPFNEGKIKSYMNSNTPVTIIVDTYDYANCFGYQKVHTEHDLLVKNFQDNKIECCDPYSEVHDFVITPGKILIKDEMIVFRKATLNYQNDIQTVILSACKYYLKQDYNKNVILFAEHLNDLCANDYFGSVTNAILSPFFIRYRSIIANRYSLLPLVSSLMNMEYFIVLFKKIVKEWNNSYMLFMKLLSTKDETLKMDISDHLFKIAKFEYEFCLNYISL